MKRRAQLKLAFRITAAGLIAFAFSQAFALPQGYWAVFTAVLVVQGSVGGSIKAAVDRLIGTLSGAFYGGVVATLVPHGDPLMTGIALGLSLLPLAYLGAINPSFRVAPITAVILLLGSVGANEGPLLAGATRVLEVAIGGLVGLAVSLVVAPARAHAIMGEETDRLLQEIAVLARDVIGGSRCADSDKAAITRQHDRIQAEFDRLEAASAEAKREQQSLLSGDADPEPIPRTLRRIYHDLVLMGRVAAEPLPDETDAAALQVPLKTLAATLAEFLSDCGLASAERRPPPASAECADAMRAALNGIGALQGGVKLVALGFRLRAAGPQCRGSGAARSGIRACAARKAAV